MDDCEHLIDTCAKLARVLLFGGDDTLTASASYSPRVPGGGSLLRKRRPQTTGDSEAESTAPVRQADAAQQTRFLTPILSLLMVLNIAGARCTGRGLTCRLRSRRFVRVVVASGLRSPRLRGVRPRRDGSVLASERRRAAIHRSRHGRIAGLDGPFRHPWSPRVADIVG